MYSRIHPRSQNPAHYTAAREALYRDLADATIIQMIDDVVIESVRILEKHSLRASDAVHVASAIIWQADVFASSDDRQCAAAKSLGLRVVSL